MLCNARQLILSITWHVDIRLCSSWDEQGITSGVLIQFEQVRSIRIRADYLRVFVLAVVYQCFLRKRIKISGVGGRVRNCVESVLICNTVQRMLRQMSSEWGIKVVEQSLIWLRVGLVLRLNGTHVHERLH